MKKKRKSTANQRKITQDTASAWDVVVLSFKVMFKKIQYWIKPNVWYLLLSIPLFTSPGAKAAMVEAVGEGLRDPEHSQVNLRRSMKESFWLFFIPALGLSLVKWVSFLTIAFSIYFWSTQELVYLRVVTILALYGLVVWGMANAYLYPVLVEHPQWPLMKVIKTSFSIAAKHPFETLMLCVINLLLLIFGLILLGPILCIVPVLRVILSIHFYWYFTGKVIPGFMDVYKYYATLEKEVIE